MRFDSDSRDPPGPYKISRVGQGVATVVEAQPTKKPTVDLPILTEYVEMLGGKMPLESKAARRSSDQVRGLNWLKGKIFWVPQRISLSSPD